MKQVNLLGELALFSTWEELIEVGWPAKTKQKTLDVNCISLANKILMDNFNFILLDLFIL